MSQYLATNPLLPESTYRLSETFLKKLVGRTDIEDALQRLETVTVEETRMAAAEALKAIHDVGNGVRGIHDAVKVVEDCVRDTKEIIQAVDDRMKEERALERAAGNADNVQGPIKETQAKQVKGAHIIRNLSSELPLSISLM